MGYLKVVLNRVKMLVKRLVNGLGYDVCRYNPPLDYVDKEYGHVLDVVYDNFNRDKLITVPLKDCRFMHFHGFAARYDSKSPFIQTIKDYLDGTYTTYEGSALERFYEAYQPKNVQEVLGVGELKNQEYAQMHPSSVILSWSSLTPEERLRNVNLMEIREIFVIIFFFILL